MQDRNKYTQWSALRRLVTTTWNLAFADGIALVTIALFVIMLGRMYGSAALGKFSFAVALTSLAQTITDAGYDITLPRSISRDPASALNQTSDALRIKIFLALFTLPLAIAASLTKDVDTILTTVILAADVLPGTLSYALIGSLRGLNHSSQAARINALYNVTPILVCIALLWMGLPIYVFALLIFSGDLAKYFHLEREFNKVANTRLQLSSLYAERRSFFDLKLISDTWRDQRGVTITNLYSAALVRMPSVMLGLLATDAQHGVYAAASRFFTALRIVPGALLNAILPAYSQRNDSSARIRSVLGLALLFSIFLGSALYFGAPLLMQYTFGYVDSVIILQTLAFAFMALFMKTTLEAFLLSSNREKLVNAVLASVAVLAVIGYAVTAKDSALNVARIVCAAETILCISFIVVFVLLKRLPGRAFIVAESETP